MFMNKDKPELYELLKMNKSKLGRAPAQEKDEQAISAPITTPSDSEPIPYTTQQSNAAKPYPKLKIPFPTLKPKEPTGVFKKSKPIRPKTKEKEETQYNYPKIIVIGGVIVLILVIIYMALSLPKTTQPTHGRTTQQTDKEQETPPPPVTTSRTWSLRLIYYTNNAEGSRAIANMCRMLNDKNITIFTKSEVINGVSCNSVYLGKYSSLEQAQKELTKELPKLTKVHYKLKGASVVELKEGR